MTFSSGACSTAPREESWRRSARIQGGWTMDLYDTIGRGYRRLRRQDPRIAAQIFPALGSSARVVNDGAATGSSEPRHSTLPAAEPSMVMIRQRDPGAAP